MNEAAVETLDRGLGIRIGKEEAREIATLTDRKGLMHTVNGDWKVSGPRFICNCCADYCYPFRASVLLESERVWPLPRYIAEYNPSVCRHCGRCITRCHFNASRFEEEIVAKGYKLTGAGINGEKALKPENMSVGDSKAKHLIRYNRDKCRRCGLRVNTCKSGAISMRPVCAEEVL